METERRRNPRLQDNNGRKTEQELFGDASPQPDFKMSAPTLEDYAAWCEHPVTRWVAAQKARAADMLRLDWEAGSWGAGVADPDKLREYRATAEAYLSFTQMTRDDYVKHLEGR